jgi:predicted metal-dependent hydrolase
VTDIVELFAELSLKSVMKIQTQIIDIEDIAVEIIRKSVKNWRLLVNLQGHVRITVPTRASETAIRCAIAPKLDWIRKKQATFLAHPITPLHRYIHGETHPLWGEAYQLHVIDHRGRSQVKIRPPNIIQLCIDLNTTTEQRQTYMQQWYKRQIMHEAPKLIAKWELLIGVQPESYYYRTMRSKWGSCNITDRKICLNIDLAKRPIACLEFVIVHELVHLLERNHNARFYGLMDQFLPSWKIASQLLDTPQ